MKKNRVGLMLMGVVPLLASMSMRAAEAFSPDDRLRHAMKAGDVDQLNAAIAAGADPNKIYTSGFIPLNTAIKNDNLEMVKALLKAGADPDRMNGYGGIPLDDAINVGDDFCSDPTSKECEDRKAIIKALIEEGATVTNDIARSVTETPIVQATIQEAIAERDERRAKAEAAIQAGYGLRDTDFTKEEGKVKGYEDLPSEVAQSIAEVLFGKKQKR